MADSGPIGDFRISFTERSRPSGNLTLPGTSYGEALRRTSQEILGGTGDRATVYLGSTPVAEAYLQDDGRAGRGRKFSVRIVGEKPSKYRAKTKATSRRVAPGEGHEAAAGRLCTWGPDGTCTGCGVAMGDCHACSGVGYHEAGCPESDETIASGPKTSAQMEREVERVVRGSYR